MPDELVESEIEIDDALPEAVDTAAVLDDPGDANVVLPPHMRCASHTLNLVATTDISNPGDAKYK